ncbi:MAG: SMP-30/gluconolactonase/LRE family protein [Aquabacterium sp.]|uniref:SMP-30/gluconolactonase/LRE family protein n=1 Tax=Aquabacterium sp. TaxID=1872578 RepID=UPI0025C07FC5|nr:SMP-30/gluconolactonase/LRE family protein [Aquabacterium sp.]MBI5927478.1 SMP-30/gluconolactonase/LRE family protein [Aquabacterium sp.]
MAIRKTRQVAGHIVRASLWALAGLTGAAQASDPGMPDCGGTGALRVLDEKQGAIESLAFLPSGKLVFSNNLSGVLKRKDGPAMAPVAVAEGLKFPGGIVVNSEREIMIGTGNGLGGLTPSLGLAGIARVDLIAGTVMPVIKGLSMANGLVRATDGTYYASDDLAKSLDRVLPDGTVQRKWLAQNSNGLALSQDGRTLYVNQFLPAGIKAVNLVDGQVRDHAKVPSQRSLAGLDGLTIDDHGNLYVVAYFSGEVWRASPQGSLCRLVSGLSLPSAVAIGREGQGFLPDSLYIATHSGRLMALPGAVPR